MVMVQTCDQPSSVLVDSNPSCKTLEDVIPTEGQKQIIKKLCGVPQGSCLSPFFLSVQTKDLSTTAHGFIVIEPTLNY